jgi:hypothetical protein
MSCVRGAGKSDAMPKAKTEHGILPGDSGFMTRMSLGRAGTGYPWERLQIFFEGRAPASIEEKR